MVSNSIGQVTTGSITFFVNAPKSPRNDGVYIFDIRIEPQTALDQIHTGTDLEKTFETTLPEIYVFINRHLCNVVGFSMESYYAFWALFHDRPNGKDSTLCIKPLSLNRNGTPPDPCQLLTFTG